MSLQGVRPPATKRVTAGRVRQRIGAVTKWAVAQGYRDDNPAGDANSAARPKAAVRKQHMREVRQRRPRPGARGPHVPSGPGMR